MAEVETSRDGAVLTITLNRPDVLNAFTAELHRQLVGAFKDARADDVRAVVITGAGRGFCVGQDLNEFGEAARDIAGRLRGNYHPTIRAVREHCPQMSLEVLTGDFKGRTADIDTVLNYEQREAIVRGYAAKAGFAARVVSR